MTIVVAINDYNGQFDMRVKSCVAHDGIQQPIVLTDEYGCVLRPKMLTPFTKLKNPESHKKATILSYSRFLAFKFPDSMTVQIQCTVEVCRHGCAGKFKFRILLHIRRSFNVWAANEQPVMHVWPLQSYRLRCRRFPLPRLDLREVRAATNCLPFQYCRCLSASSFHCGFQPAAGTVSVRKVASSS